MRYARKRTILRCPFGDPTCNMGGLFSEWRRAWTVTDEPFIEQLFRMALDIAGTYEGSSITGHPSRLRSRCDAFPELEST